MMQCKGSARNAQGAIGKYNMVCKVASLAQQSLPKIKVAWYALETGRTQKQARVPHRTLQKLQHKIHRGQNSTPHTVSATATPKGLEEC